MSTLDEINANLTWYKLNSNYQDPVFKYMQTIYTDFLRKTPITEFSTLDNIIFFKSAIVNYGKYECSAGGKEAYVDSWISCLLFQLPFFLEKIQLGYIGFIFVLPIMLISLFGGIKESYRWFILIQAIWDAFICYDFICAKPTLLGWFGKSYTNQTTCFYFMDSSTNQYLNASGKAFRDFLRNASFIPIFLLAFSRFICMYFSRIYQSFTKKSYKMILFIILFHLFFIFAVSAQRFYSVLSVMLTERELEKCFDSYCITSIYKNDERKCFQNIPAYFQCFNQVYESSIIIIRFLAPIPFLIPPIMFLLSNICAGLLLYKIVSQLKFQLKTNRDSFIQTIKISSVIGFQCTFMSFYFVITSITKLLQFSIGNSGDYSPFSSLPTWLFFLQYHSTTTSLNLIRVFLDSFFVLTFLKGYSSSVLKSFKFIQQCFLNPRGIFKNFKNKLNGKSSVTVISHFAKKDDRKRVGNTKISNIK